MAKTQSVILPSKLQLKSTSFRNKLLLRKRLYVYFIKDLENYYSLNSRKSAPGFFSKLLIFFTNRGLWLLSFYRFRYTVRQHVYRKKHRDISTIGKVLFSLVEFFIQILTKSQLDYRTELKSRVYLSNNGNMVVGCRKIGSGSIIQKNITIGKNNNVSVGFDNRPEISRNVWIGSGSVIYGSIKIGEGVTICENTVLSRSIPANCVVKGNPARVIQKNFDNKQLRMSPESHSSLFLPQNKNLKK